MNVNTSNTKQFSETLPRLLRNRPSGTRGNDLQRVHFQTPRGSGCSEELSLLYTFEASVLMSSCFIYESGGNNVTEIPGENIAMNSLPWLTKRVTKSLTCDEECRS